MKGFGVICAIVFFVLATALSLGWQESYARRKVEAKGWTVVEMHYVLFGCSGAKGRFGYRFKTDSGHTGKVCASLLQPTVIHYDG